VEDGVVKKPVFLEKCLQRLVKVDIMALVSESCEKRLRVKKRDLTQY
jgi:hypothetical protein